MERRFYRVDEIAKMFGVSVWTVRRWIHRGVFDGAVKIGQSLFVPKESVDKAIKEGRERIWEDGEH